MAPTNIFHVIKHVKTQHDEQDKDGEHMPFHFLWKNHLADSSLNLHNHSSTGICDPGCETTTATKVGEDAVVDLVGVTVELLLRLLDPLEHLPHLGQAVISLILQLFAEQFKLCIALVHLGIFCFEIMFLFLKITFSESCL